MTPSRAQIWVQFMVAAMIGNSYNGAEDSAEEADDAITQFEKRFKLEQDANLNKYFWVEK